MEEIIQLILFSIKVFLLALTECNNFISIGKFAIVATILAILIGIHSYYIYYHESQRLIYYDMFPNAYPLSKQEIPKIEKKILKFNVSTLICYYIFVFCGLITIIYLLSTILRLMQ